MESLFQATLLAAAFLCSVVAGFLFAFAAVVMPGLGSLDDARFIRAFQVIDRIIQDNQPLFVFVWTGAALTSIAAATLGIWALGGVDRLLVAAAALINLLGVQLPTGMVNVPLNNRLQGIDVAAAADPALRRAREAFEPRWNRWNTIRTVCASLASVLLLLVLLGA